MAGIARRGRGAATRGARHGRNDAGDGEKRPRPDQDENQERTLAKNVGGMPHDPDIESTKADLERPCGLPQKHPRETESDHVESPLVEPDPQFPAGKI